MRKDGLDVLDLERQREAGSRSCRRECIPRRPRGANRAACYDDCVSLRRPVASPSSRSGELLAELLPIVGEINAVLDPDELLPTIARQLRRIVDYRILDIFLPEADGTLVPALSSATTPELAGRLRLRPGEGIVGAAAAARETVFVPDVRHGPALHRAGAGRASPSWPSRSSTATGWWAC